MGLMFKYVERIFDIVWPHGNFQHVGSSFYIYRLASPKFPRVLASFFAQPQALEEEHADSEVLSF